MPFKIRQITQVEFIVDERLFLTRDGREVVGDGDPRASSLLAGAGQIISAKTAARYGLTATPEAKDTPTPTPEVKSRTTRVLKADTRD